MAQKIIEMAELIVISNQNVHMVKILLAKMENLAD